MHSIVAARTRLAYHMCIVCVCVVNICMCVCVFELMPVHCTRNREHSYSNKNARKRECGSGELSSRTTVGGACVASRATGVQRSHTQPTRAWPALCTTPGNAPSPSHTTPTSPFPGATNQKTMAQKTQARRRVLLLPLLSPPSLQCSEYVVVSRREWRGERGHDAYYYWACMRVQESGTGVHIRVGTLYAVRLLLCSPALSTHTHTRNPFREITPSAALCVVGVRHLNHTIIGNSRVCVRVQHV